MAHAGCEAGETYLYTPRAARRYPAVHADGYYTLLTCDVSSVCARECACEARYRGRDGVTVSPLTERRVRGRLSAVVVVVVLWRVREAVSSTTTSSEYIQYAVRIAKC